MSRLAIPKNDSCQYAGRPLLPHPIRLRGGWEMVSDQGRTPVNLPTIWSKGVAGFARLERHFQWPATNAETEQIFLLFLDVEGLREIQLDGNPLAAQGGAAFAIPIKPGKFGRSLLQLIVDFAGIVPGTPWGKVALVVALHESNASDIARLDL